MAGSTGSARQEAERLVATVLAMAAQSGVGGKDDDLSRTRQRITEGIGALGDTLANVVDQLAATATGHRPPAGTEGSDSAKSGTRASGSAESGPHGSGDAESGARGSGGGESGDAESGAQGSGGGESGAQGSEARESGGQGSGGQRSGGHGSGAWGFGGQGSGGQGFGGWGWVGRGIGGWAAGTAGRGLGHGFAGWATGSPECCVCPLCRAIAAVRDPTPQTAARLATGAGDLATGVASMMRALSALSGTRSRPAKPAKPTRPVFDPDVAWSAATRTSGEAGRHEAPAEDLDPDTTDPWTAATRTAPTPGRHEAPAQPADEAVVADKPGVGKQPAPAAKPAPAEKTARTDKPVGRPPAPGADPWAAATAAPAAGGGTLPGSGAADLARGVDQETASGDTGSRTENGPEGLGVEKAAAGGGMGGVAETSVVDHDDSGSAPGASTAEGRGVGDDARAGDAG
jgi:hypothetical protein